MADCEIRLARPVPEWLRESPPSVKLVVKALQRDGPLTIDQLAAETLLPDRTIRYALARLTDHDAIEEHASLRDTHKKVYSLAPSLRDDC